MLPGLMQDAPLLISNIIEHAATYHGDTEIVSRTVEGGIHRYTYAGARHRAKRLAQALGRLGVGEGQRVATLAWNGYRHFELYYAISGMGAVIHTINPRLFGEQIEYIVGHAEDQYVFFDLTFVPIIEKLAPRCPGVKGWVAMTDRAHMPAIPGVKTLCYEELVDAENGDYAWPSFDERSASTLCYTSGTTGNPKGVLYSHRSTVLHALGASLPDVFSPTARDSILPVVPMFHVNSWGTPYFAPLNGSKLVLPGAQLDGKSLYELFESERVTITAGVPTVWLGLLGFMKQNGLKFSTLKRAVVGGSAAPPAMIREFRDDFGVDCQHAWGMTEMSPLGTFNTTKAKHDALPAGELFQVRCNQGRAIFGVAMKIVDGDGVELPRDGKAFGDLLVKGPWVTRGYFKGEGGDPLVRRLVPHRRRRDHRSGRLHADHRPVEGRDQVRRRVDQLDRSREHRGGASGRRRSRGDFRLPSQVGRTAADRRGEEARRRGDARRTARRSTRARSRSGGSRTTWCSSSSCRTPRPASCSRRSCARSSRTTSSRPRDPGALTRP